MSIVQLRVDSGLTTSAGLVWRIAMEWSPGSNWGSCHGEVQGAHAPPSSRHSTGFPNAVSNTIAMFLWLVNAGGAELIRGGSGDAVFTVQDALETGLVFP